MVSVNAQRLRQFSRATSDFIQGFCFHPFLHNALPGQRLQCPNQDRIRFVFLVGDYIEQMVDAITEVNVSYATLFKHYLVSWRHAFESMAAAFFVRVCLRFYYNPTR